MSLFFPATCVRGGTSSFKRMSRYPRADIFGTEVQGRPSG